MKILITGANGMVARAAFEWCRANNDEVFALTRQEFDITDRDLVYSAVESINPDAVINCAAFTDVDGAEADEDACFKANADGPENLAIASRTVDAAFITISTDYVFDGLRSDFYTQRDTPNPQSVYARSKLEGEIRVRYTYGRSIIVRTGWIYGDGGKNFLSVVYERLSKNQPVKAISDSYGTPTYACDLARRLRELATLDLPGIYHVTNSGPGTSYLGFAEAICRIGGFDERLIKPISQSELLRPAPRPTSSKLACLFSKRLGLAELPDWEAALRRFLKIEKAAKATLLVLNYYAFVL